MVDENILARVTEATAWASPIVLVNKPGTDKLRFCMDPSALNNAIQREHYQIKTSEEIFADLAGCEYFSTLDATSGFFTSGVGGKELLSDNHCNTVWSIQIPQATIRDQLRPEVFTGLSQKPPRTFKVSTRMSMKYWCQALPGKSMMSDCTQYYRDAVS